MLQARRWSFVVFLVALLACGSSKERVDAPKPNPEAQPSASAVASAQPSASAASSAAPEQVATPTEWHPLLFKIAGAKPSYLFGTIHVPDSRLGTFPAPMNSALASADEVVTEMPLDDTSPMHAMQLSSLPAGKTLSTELPKAVYDRLKATFDAKGLGMAFPMLERMKIWAIAVQVGLLDHLKDLIGGAKPIDVVLHDRAVSMTKKTSGLETENEQLAVFDGLTKDEQTRFLEESLDERDKAERDHKDLFVTLMNLYIAGDEGPLLKELNSGFDTSKPLDVKLMKRLITDRNKIMSDRIATKVKAPRSYFFAVGAAHLLGDDGVVAQLKKKGLTVDRVQ